MHANANWLRRKSTFGELDGFGAHTSDRLRLCAETPQNKAPSKHSLPFFVTYDLRLVPEEYCAPIVGPAVGHLLVAGRKELLSAPQLLGGSHDPACFSLRFDSNPWTEWRMP